MMRTEKYTDQLSKRLNELYEEVDNAKKNNNYMETDLKKWLNSDSTILNCEMHSGLNGYMCHFELNDTTSLLSNNLSDKSTYKVYIQNYY
jgi:hypothetical protein